jgi:tol-pal system protein YbgF
MRPVSSALALVLIAQLAGCFWTTTKSEGKALRHDVDALNTRVDTKEKDLAGQLEKLQAILDEATKVLKRNSADLGADVQAMQDDMRTMHGLLTAAKTYTDEVKAGVDRLNARVDTIDQRLALLEKGGAPAGPGTPVVNGANPDDLWAQGRAAFEASKWDEARDAFKKLVVQFPNNDRADDAQYFRAESYFTEKNFDDAIREYQKVYDKYPASPLADDAMFRAGESAEQLKNCTEARAYFGQLKQKYPQSNLVKKSDEKDKALKAAAKNKAKCTS